MTTSTAPAPGSIAARIVAAVAARPWLRAEIVADLTTATTTNDTKDRK